MRKNINELSKEQHTAQFDSVKIVLNNMDENNGWDTGRIYSLNLGVYH